MKKASVARASDKKTTVRDGNFIGVMQEGKELVWTAVAISFFRRRLGGTTSERGEGGQLVETKESCTSGIRC